VTLTLTFIYELDPYSLDIHRKCKYELSTSGLSKVFIIQTDRHDRNYILHPFAGGQKSVIRNGMDIVDCTVKNVQSLRFKQILISS